MTDFHQRERRWRTQWRLPSGVCTRFPCSSPGSLHTPRGHKMQFIRFLIYKKPTPLCEKHIRAGIFYLIIPHEKNRVRTLSFFLSFFLSRLWRKKSFCQVLFHKKTIFLIIILSLFFSDVHKNFIHFIVIICELCRERMGGSLPCFLRQFLCPRQHNAFLRRTPRIAKRIAGDKRQLLSLRGGKAERLLVLQYADALHGV